jgi:small subunit ribosomal protein S17
MATKEKIGIVVSNKMEKTAVVLVESRYAHPIYKKTLKTSKRFLAHDELNECNLGDQVVISETRPISRNKRWMIKEILKKTLLSN